MRNNVFLTQDSFHISFSPLFMTRKKVELAYVTNDCEKSNIQEKEEGVDEKSE